MGRALSLELRRSGARALAVFALAVLGEAQMSALRSEYDSIRSQLGQEATFEEGRQKLHAFVGKIIEDPEADDALVYYRAKELAEDRRLTPEGWSRAEYFAIAAEAATRLGSQDGALLMHEGRSGEYEALGELSDAARVLELGLEACPNAARQGPHSRVSLADLLRRLGEFRPAHQRPDDAPARAGGEGGVLRAAQEKGLLVRASVYRDLGASDHVLAELEALAASIQGRSPSDVASRERLSLAKIALLRAWAAQGDHARVRREAQELAGVLEGPLRAEVLALLGTSRFEEERARREEGTASERAARRDFEAALALEPSATLELFLHTRLAAESLESGDLVQAAAQVEVLRSMQSNAPLTGRTEAAVIEARVALAQSAPTTALLACRAKLLDAWTESLEAWRRALRLDGPAQAVAFLKYTHRRAALSQLFELERALAPGDQGVRSALDHLLVAQEVSSLRGAAPPASKATVDRLRSSLLTGADHGLLVYLPARDASHVFAIDRTSIAHHRLVRSATIEARRKEYVSWLLLQGVSERSAERQAELIAEERKRASALSRVLLPPQLMARVSTWNRISLSGFDTLGIVPFAWLPLGDEPYLGTRRAVDFVPSLPYALERAAVPALSGGKPDALDLLLVTDARPGAAARARWPFLEPVDLGATGEAQFDEVYGPTGWLALRGDHASPEQLNDYDLSNVVTLQFLVHAVEETEALVPVALALSPGAEASGADGLWRAADVAALEAAPSLVVLTACGSGQGPTRRGDPLVGSPIGAWLARGARAVIAAQHRMTLGEARRTTAWLHAELRAGHSPAQAMRRARHELVEGVGGLAPFVHAMQQVVGSGQAALFDRAAPAPAGRLAFWMLWVGGVGLVGLVIASWVSRSKRRGPEEGPAAGPCRP